MVPAVVILKDIAAEAGFSIHTVSDILNADDTRYSESTRRNVREVARRLGYRPSRMAQTMRTGRSRTVALINRTGLLQVASERATALTRALAEHGYDVLHLDLALQADHWRGLYHKLIDARIDGLVITVMGDDIVPGELALFRKAGIPMVSISARHMPGIPLVQADARQGIRDVTRHLIATGRKRLVYAGIGDLAAFWRDQRFWVLKQRAMGFCDAIRAAGGTVTGETDSGEPATADPTADAPCRGELIATQDPPTFDPYIEGHRTMSQLLARSNPPDAVVFKNDCWAVGGLGACQKAGVRVPEDVAITGFDDTALARAVWPPLTTVRQPIEAMARKTVELLLARMRGKPDADEASVIELPCELIVRGSSGGADACSAEIGRGAGQTKVANQKEKLR